MKSYKRLVMVAFLTLGAMPLFVARAEESGKTEKSAKTKQSISLPDKVAAAFAKSYPKAKVLNVSKETKDSVTYFEVESKDGNVRRDILYTVDGNASEVEESVPSDALPNLVTLAVKKDQPSGKIEKAERITKGAMVEYEVTVDGKGGTVELLYDVSGKLLKTTPVNEDDEKDEADEND
jgi:hypothetical protein